MRGSADSKVKRGTISLIRVVEANCVLQCLNYLIIIIFSFFIYISSFFLFSRCFFAVPKLVNQPGDQKGEMSDISQAVSAANTLT